MLGRLFSKLFGRKGATSVGAGSRPVSPPRPTVPLAAPPPPPPPPAGAASRTPSTEVPPGGIPMAGSMPGETEPPTANPEALSGQAPTAHPDPVGVMPNPQVATEARPAEEDGLGEPPLLEVSPPEESSTGQGAADPLGDPFADTFAPTLVEPAQAEHPSPAAVEAPAAVADATSVPTDPSLSGPEAATPIQGETELGVEAQETDAAPSLGGRAAGADGTGGVRIILQDGTLAKPSLDPELEERLRYIVDNIVSPSSPPPEGPAT